MKTNKILTAAVLAVAGVAFTGCDDFIDDNRWPETSLVNNPAYWNNYDNCNLQINRFYGNFDEYGYNGTTGTYYFSSLTDDQTGTGFVNWKFTAIPSTDGNFTSPYSTIRGLNIIIENVEKSTLTQSQKNDILGQARMNRAIQYFNLVKKYGDVPLVTKVLDIDSPELYDARTPRKTVEDFIYEDLVFASQNIGRQNGIQRFSKDMALAILSDFCLYEGTFWKYCTQADNYYAPDLERSNTFLNRCVEHSNSLIDAYPISASYAALYNSAWSADNAAGITGLSSNKEVIFATEYEKDLYMHSTVAYTASSTILRGITKDAFDNYLFKDGLPKCKTTYDTSDAGTYVEHLPGAVKNDKGEYGPGLSIKALLDVRDARLAQTIDSVVYYKGMGWSRSGTTDMTSATGYGVKKFDNVNMPVNYRVNTTKNYTCPPVYWGAVICLNYAEAKAELGTLTDADMNRTLNKLYARAGLPDQTVASLTAIEDTANNMGVSSLLWEVRRCRRCELIMDKDIRYWDLVRWHKLDLLDNTKYPNILLGANVSNAKVKPGSMVGEYVDGSFGGVRMYEPRQYEYPIPSGQITLNENLTQQPLWAK